MRRIKANRLETEKNKRTQKFCKILYSIAVINFGIFIIGTIILGGSANLGKIEAGHYYVGEHGKYIEVPYSVFIYSQIHAFSLLITHPLGILAGLIDWVLSGMPLMRRNWLK